MTVFSREPTHRSSGASSPASWLRLIVVAAALALAGCNANQEVSPSSQTASQVFAGRYADTNPYNPISYAQNNTGRGGGGH
jgi:hypothetical protein